MYKRWISFLLAVIMVLGLMPSGVMAEPAPEESVYTQNLTIRWGENGEYRWERWYDPETGSYGGNGADELPTGVAWVDNVLTLSGAELWKVEICNFGPIPVTICVEGENTIRCGTDGDESAVRIDGCFDVGMEGSGTLELAAGMVPFRIFAADPATGLYCPDARLEIRDLTLKAENIRPEENYSEEESWYFGAVSMQTNVTILGAKLELRGREGPAQGCAV